MSSELSQKIGQTLLDDEPESEQEAYFRECYFATQCEDTQPCDEMPGAEGTFGTSLTNPIPVNGVIGETVYLNRLMTQSGAGFLYHRRGSLSTPIHQNDVDKFELVATDASEWRILYLSPYYPRRSRRAPEGLSLMTWNSMSGIERILCKLEYRGTRMYSDGFPEELPLLVSVNQGLRNCGSDIAAKMGHEIREILEKYQGNWERPSELECDDVAELNRTIITGKHYDENGELIVETEIISQGEAQENKSSPEYICATLRNLIVHLLEIVNNLSSQDQQVCKQWLGDPNSEWADEHKESCCIGLLHVVFERRRDGLELPDSILSLMEYLPFHPPLQPLDEPLDNTMIGLFERLLERTNSPQSSRLSQ